MSIISFVTEVIPAFLLFSSEELIETHEEKEKFIQIKSIIKNINTKQTILSKIAWKSHVKFTEKPIKLIGAKNKFHDCTVQTTEPERKSKKISGKLLQNPEFSDAKYHVI